jgi:uncharacterized membrane protein
VLEFLKPFAAGLVTFLALDLAWIGYLANAFYKRELAGLARMEGEAFAIRLVPALLLYPLILLGLQLLALPRVTAGQPLSAAVWGGLYGLVGYGIYDLTNYATLAQYSWRMTVVDMAWGTVLCAVTATVMTLVAAPR